MVEVAGYPGEKQCYFYAFSGRVKEVRATPLGGYVVMYDVDTTECMAGSAIHLVESDLVQSHQTFADMQRSYTQRGDNHNLKKMVIGIHTGTSESEACNYGTLITPEISRWINNNCYAMQ